MTLPTNTQAIFDNAIAHIFNVFEEEIIYGDYHTVGLVKRISEDEKQAGFFDYDAELTIKRNDVLSPSNGDEVWIDDKVYKVGKVIKDDLTYWTLSLYFQTNVHSRESKEWR